MQNNFKNCQSCRAQLNKDKKGGGTKTNGDRSSMYYNTNLLKYVI